MEIESTAEIATEVESKIAAEEQARAERGPTGGYPVCPYCKSDPATFNSIPMKLGAVQYVILYCSNRRCRKIHSASIISVDAPRVMPAPPGAIIRP